MRLLTRFCVFAASLIVAGCAATIQVSSLTKPTIPGRAILVSQFKYHGGFPAVDAGTYTVEYESPEGFFYRGPGLPIQLDKVLNMNRVNFPDDKFPGGIFVPRSGDPAGYRIYYYQVNIPGATDTTGLGVTTLGITQAAAPAAGSVAAGAGAGLGAGIGAAVVGYMIDSGRGQIVICFPLGENNIASYVRVH